MSVPQIKHFANLWTLVDYPGGSAQGQWTNDQKLAAVKAAGFDGFQWAPRPELIELSQRHSLTYLGLCDANETNYRQKLEAFVPIRPPVINVQLCDHDTEPADAVRTWIELEKAALDLGLAVDLEVHRDTCTETPEKTWRIAELYEQQIGRLIRFNFDLSHFAVVKQMAPPYAERMLTRPDLIRLSRQMHLRPFNGNHCQIPISDGAGNLIPLAKPWLDFVAAIFACWLEGGRENETLWVCPEMGALTSGYWIPPFPDPWKDAVLARGEFDRLWSQTV